MKCPKCNFENPKKAKFCMECGAKLENVCPECGAKLPETAKFCMECGAKVGEVEEAKEAAPPSVVVPKLEEIHAQLQRSMPKSLAEKFQSVTPAIDGENRILSILYGDISGSVAITEQMSPEDAADLINECLKVMVDIILKYEGSINRFLGDCVLAFFGTPTTHENDSERAILAALEMCEAVTKLNLNISIGINTGMVYVGAMGPDEHREFTAMGTAVNLAARLEGVAEAGQILVGESTYRLTRRAFAFNPLLPLTLRGITEPVSAYEVLEVLPQPEKLRGIEGLRTEMIGREKEFADLKERVDDLLAGRGQLVSLIGEAGVGKSRLATELKGYIQDKEINWLEGRCVSIGESIGYWVFIDILRSYLQFSDEDSSKEMGEKIVATMKALFPQRWEDIIPYIGNLLSLKFSNEWDDKVKYLSPEQVKYQTFLTLRDVFLALAQQKPLLLILEDMHWADNLSLDFITLLMDALSLAPLMLLCIYRPDKEHKSWHIDTQASGKCLDRYKQITLRALNPQESRRLVESLLRIENFPVALKESILKKAEGNPFFVEEVIRSLIDSKVVYRDGEKWVAKAEVEAIAVPDTIQNVIMARIDRLEDEVRYVLQSAAVIGRLFRHKLLQYTTQQERNLDRYLWQLEESALVYEERAIPELEYSFRHALTQETAYNTILSRRRREFHHKVGEGYEALYSTRIEEYYEELAYHYSRSDDSQKALHYLVKAGDKSKATFANEQATEYYNQTLKLMDEIEGVEPTLRGHIYQSLGEIYIPLVNYEKALECCRNALEYTADNKKRAKIYGIMGHIYLGQKSKPDLVLKYLNAGIAELGDDIECPEMARLSIPLTWATVYKGNTTEAIDIALRGLKIVEGTEYYSETMELYICLIWTYGLVGNDYDKALECAQRTVEVAKKSERDDLIGYSNGWLAVAYWLKGEDDVAIKLMEKAIEIGKKIEDYFAIGQGTEGLALFYQKREDWDRVIECLQRCIEISGHPWHNDWLSYLAWSYLQKGDPEKAIQYSKKALEAASNSMAIARNIGFIEEAYTVMGKREKFVSYCRKVKKQKEEEFQELKLNQWYLELKESSGLFTETVCVDKFEEPDLKPEWEWKDPRGDSAYNLSKEANWLEMRAASGSDLIPYFGNFGAPRLLQEISGDFAVEIKLKAASSVLPSIGGLLVWKDNENYIRLERGISGKNEISLSGNIQGEYSRFGRGMLTSDTLYLRLERIDDRFSAYCSGDEINWWSCGEVISPAEDPIQIGIHTIGFVGLMGILKLGVGMDTATRFDYFKIFRIPE